MLLIVASFCIYVANQRLVSSGDNMSSRYLPFAILGHGTLRLDPIRSAMSQGYSDPYWVLKRNGHFYSTYPVAVPVLVTPLYVPAVAYLNYRGWTDERLDRVSRIMEKGVSALIASLSVGLMYLLLVRRAKCPWALWLTIAFGLGTNTWMITSQALWQHGMAELLLVLSLYLLLGPCTGQRSWWAGVVLGLIVCARPPDGLLAVAMGLFGLRWAAGRRWLLVTGGAVPVLLVLAYNWFVMHRVAGGYGFLGNLDSFRHSMFGGIAGLLISPARGLLFYSPFLLFLPFCLRYAWREREPRMLVVGLLVAFGAQVLLYSKLDWRAGCCWGPRWLTDTLPLLVWMLAAGMEHLNRAGRGAFVLATAMSIWAQFVGAFWYTGESDAVLLATGGDPSRVPAVWDVRNSPIAFEFRHERAPRELTVKTQGAVDRIKVAGQDVEQITAGAEVEIEGWTLTNRRTPSLVKVTLAPTRGADWARRAQYPAAQTNAFVPRLDVAHGVGGAGPSGWRVVLATNGLRPGPYWLEVRARVHPRGDLFAVVQRHVKVVEAPPAAPAPTRAPMSQMSVLYELAKERIRSRQDASGYWLTAHTVKPRFARPLPEMNTFATSLVIDALAPVAQETGLIENVERARRHLAEQIESDGLVRYHGRPDSPTIPKLGVVITPDADDTTLVWRISGRGDDPRRAKALEILKSYRTPDGLYKTWLAPREKFISLDPGKDPNPADVGIQMHVMMFLASVDPAAASELQKSLQAAANEQRIWVYYEVAPLVPILRGGDLRSLGYEVRLPEERLKSPVPGQELWVTACRQLAQYATKEGPRPAQAETLALLESLAKNNFEAIRSNPPLFYHNDRTAKCSRYYWSEDWGYAIWLRLYTECGIGPIENLAAKEAGTLK